MRTFRDEVFKILRKKLDKIDVSASLWRDDTKWHLKLTWKNYNIYVCHPCRYEETAEQVAVKLHSMAAATKWSTD